MRHARVLGFASLAIAAVGAVAFAQTTVAPLPDNPPVVTAPLDIDMGKTVWGDAEAGQSKASACAACHGVDGNPIDPQYPRIAGQPERYTSLQLALYASGQRNTGLAAIMMPYAQALSPQDMRDVGAYFSRQKSQAGLADVFGHCQAAYPLPMGLPRWTAHQPGRIMPRRRQLFAG